MLTRASAAGCLVAALLALGAGPALARFAPTGQPPGAVLGFGVSGSSWLALVVPGSAPGAVVFGTGVPYVSHDAGATWQQVAMNGLKDPFPGVDVAVAPDGAFWLSVQDYQSAATFLMRMDRNGTAFDPVARFPSTQSTTQVSVPAWDMQEHLWAAVTSGQPRQSEVDRVAADGTIAERVPVNVENGSARRVTFVGGRLYADFGTIQIFQVRGKSATALGQSGQNTVSIGFPLLAVGKSVLTESGLSFDGGQTFASRFTAVRAVVGNDRLVRTLASFGATQADGGRILRRVSSRFFAPTALTLPTNTTFVGQARQALVAVAGGEVQLHGGAVPKLTARGHLSATARGMIARANHWRHQAGLPPMLGDAGIARASLNHANYWGRRNFSFRQLGLNAHSETKGTKGFTGVTPTDRCAHVKAECGGEVINFGNQARNPVDSWVSTPYHRQPFIDPSITYAGGARVGNVAVMNFSTSVQSIALAPVEFPLGRYEGTLRFPGNELPDPLAACRGAHQPIGSNASMPVSFVPPVSAEGFPKVELFRGKTRVPGCTKVGFFMGKRPLSPHTRYTAKATWRPFQGSGAQTTTWSFRTS